MAAQAWTALQIEFKNALLTCDDLHGDLDFLCQPEPDLEKLHSYKQAFASVQDYVEDILMGCCHVPSTIAAVRSYIYFCFVLNSHPAHVSRPLQNLALIYSLLAAAEYDLQSGSHRNAHDACLKRMADGYILHNFEYESFAKLFKSLCNFFAA